jgi:DeoR family transcriptional regulator of aga operon
MSIKRTDRMREVLSLLRGRGEVTSQVLRTELRVSAATLRRDLSELEEQGLLLRTHGGARALDPSDSEIPVRLRDHRMIAIKRRIAQRAAALVPAGPQAGALTGGVTTGEGPGAEGPAADDDRDEFTDHRRRLRRRRTHESDRHRRSGAGEFA